MVGMESYYNYRLNSPYTLNILTRLSGRMRLGTYITAILTGVLCSVATLSISAQDPARMNILFIAVDDLKPILGCYGDTLVVTPNIDSLAKRGTLFSNNHCQQAVCAPSRVSLMTSRYPDQTRVWDLQTQMREMDPGIVSLPQYLRRFGYRTAATGKVFDPRSVDGDHDAPSWSIPFAPPWNIRYYDEETGKPAAYYYASPEAKDTIAILQAEAQQLGVDEMTYIKARYFPAFENTDVPYDAYTDGAIANVGIELLDQVAAGGSPFFLAIGFHRPHLPFNAPKEFWDLYDRSDFSQAPFRERAAGSPDLAYHNSSELRSYTGIPESGSVPDETQVTLIHGYYAATSYIDHLIGMLLNRLDELELAGKTAIVLWGDHGWHLGDHDLWCKHSNFEQATRSPLIISFPDQPNPGASTTSPTEFTDIVPTLCEIAEVELPVFFEGKSLIPLFTDTLAQVREGALSQYPRNGKMGYSLRTDRYRYTRWVDPDGSFQASELYDYEEDPLETVNRSGAAGYEIVTGRLDSIVQERIRIPSTQERILFNISGMSKQGDTASLAGAVVRFAGASYRTDSRGGLLFTHIDGDYSYEVTAPGYDPVSGFVHIDNDTVIRVYMGDPDLEASIRVLNHYTGRGVVNVQVGLNGLFKETSGEGWASFTVRKGTHTLAVEHESYENRSDTLQINGDTSFVYRLEPSHAGVKFWVKEGGAPVVGAMVILDTTGIATNALGMSTFENVPTKVTYPYSVEKSGYIPIKGEVYPVTDTTLVFQMEREPSGILDNYGRRVELFPNPVSGVLHIETPGNGSVQLLLFSSSGQLVYRAHGKGSRQTVDISPLGKGIYYLTVCTGDFTITEKLTKL